MPLSATAMKNVLDVGKAARATRITLRALRLYEIRGL